MIPAWKADDFKGRVYFARDLALWSQWIGSIFGTVLLAIGLYSVMNGLRQRVRQLEAEALDEHRAYEMLPDPDQIEPKDGTRAQN